MYSLMLMAALSGNTATPGIFWHGCHGGGCYGGGCYGGGCYGGGCYGNGCFGCAGGWYRGGYGTCFGCHGCYGCYGCYGGSYVVSPYRPMPPAGKPAEKVTEPPKEKGGLGLILPGRAKLVLDVPADAKVFIDDQPTASTGTKRVFNTPALNVGETYYYMIRVETSRDGKPIAETRRIVFRANDDLRFTFTEPPKDVVVTSASKR